MLNRKPVRSKVGLNRLRSKCTSHKVVVAPSVTKFIGQIHHSLKSYTYPISTRYIKIMSMSNLSYEFSDRWRAIKGPDQKLVSQNPAQRVCLFPRNFA